MNDSNDTSSYVFRDLQASIAQELDQLSGDIRGQIETCYNKESN